MMNPVVSAQVAAYVEANPDIATLEPHEKFEVYATFAICNGALSIDVDPNTIHLEGDEFGVDAIGLLVDGEPCVDSDDVEEAIKGGKNHEVEFVLIQAKQSESLEYGDLGKFFDATIMFFENDFPESTEQVDDLIEAKKLIYRQNLKQNPALHLYYACTGLAERSPLIQGLIDRTIVRLKNMSIFSEIYINTFGATELQAGYRAATSAVAGMLEFPNAITLPAHPSVQEAYIGYVAATQLVGLASEKDSEGNAIRLNRGVFFDNVRDYNEHSEINQSIISQLNKNEGASFVFKNNGVTIVSRTIHRTGDQFRLEDFQIVNGCQTTNVLFACRSKLENVIVPMRLIGSDKSDFVASIIVGTNRQNEVREEQFWSLSPFMKSLEEYCREQPGDRKIFLERRENQYRLEMVERRRILKPRDLLKTVAAMFLFQPHRAARNYRGVAKEFADKIFQPNHSVVAYHAAAFASFRIDALLRSKRIPRSLGIFKYYVLSALGAKFSNGKDLFTLNTKEQQKAGDALANFVSNDARFKAEFLRVAKQLEKWAPGSDREKIRDKLRTEAFNKRFARKYIVPLITSSKGKAKPKKRS